MKMNKDEVMSLYSYYEKNFHEFQSLEFWELSNYQLEEEAMLQSGADYES